MPAAIPVIASVAAGIAVANEAYAIAMVITVAAQIATQALTKTPALDSYRNTQERKQVLRAAASAKTVVYGRSLSAGTLFFSEEQEGDQADGELLHLAITLAGHPITGIGAIYLGDDTIDTYGDSATYEVHIDRQTADPYLLKNAPSWKEDMIGKGISWLRLTLKFDAEKFPSGIPNVTVEKLGRAVYDPRMGKTVYSNNAALCILDYYRNYLKVADADINWDQFQEAANICDETVTRADGKTEPRYTINGEFDLSENKASILEAMLSACSGEATYIAGKHGIIVGAYYGPAVEVISESQLAGDIEIMPEVSQSERVNTINGTFIDPQQRFSEVDFPAVSVSEWVTEDGVEISQDLKLRFVTSEYQAQRLADIKLKRTRISRTMNVTLNLSGYRYRPGMYVKVNFPSLGIINVEMRVTDWKFGVQNGVQLTLKQETAEVWGDAIGKPIDRPPFTQLPTGGVAQPQNLKYTVEEIGQVVQGVLSWQNVGQFIYNKVLIRRDGELVMSVQVPGFFTRLTGLMRDTYTAHVIAVNQMGAESPEAYLEFSIEAPPPPSKVEQKQGYFSVTLIPRLAEITNISTQFDFWTSGQTKLANINADTVEGNASRAGTGTTWTAYELQIGPVYYWYVRTINAFGTSAFIEVPVVCNTDTGELIDYIDEQIRESGAFDRLSSQIDTNIEGMLQNALDNKSSVDHQFRQYGEVRADILTVRTTIADVSKAMAEQNTLVQAQISNLTSSVNQKLTATVNSDGSASAFYDVGLQILRNGQYYKAGMAMGIEPSGGGYKSTLAFSADQFGIYTGNNPGNYQLAFAAINGQIFIRSALIQDASIDSAKIKDAAITNAKIAGTLESVGYASGNGWQFGKDNNQLNFRSANSGFFIDSTGAGLKSSAGVVLVKMGLRP
ncbi:phage tail tip protein J-related protein [Mixta calida]|uniref:DUF1983 domain-containing protein n=1 Tax=Mixta calida TaxID=665913 RepID=A0ABM6S171_9GAMM|nr:DUF1983 domain-containing protein [Mixta calida]AUY25479.1 DUF1983 domain-containing protein [Mixta calida]DAV47333.1 MAG TPA: tail protein [Caudoviricetes sp.]